MRQMTSFIADGSIDYYNLFEEQSRNIYTFESAYAFRLRIPPLGSLYF